MNFTSLKTEDVTYIKRGHIILLSQFLCLVEFGRKEVQENSLAGEASEALASGVVERRRPGGAMVSARYRSDRIPSCGRSRASSELATVRPAKTSTWSVFATASVPLARRLRGRPRWLQLAHRVAFLVAPRTRPERASLPRGVPASHPRMRLTIPTYPPFTPINNSVYAASAYVG